MNDDFFWSINVQAFAAFNKDRKLDGYAFKPSYYSYFDSGTSKILVPPSVFPTLIQMLVIANGSPENKI